MFAALAVSDMAELELLAPSTAPPRVLLSARTNIYRQDVGANAFDFYVVVIRGEQLRTDVWRRERDSNLQYGSPYHCPGRGDLVSAH
jgi:hypothetical protein